MTLASSPALKAPKEGGVDRLDDAKGAWRFSSLNSVAVTAAVASSMLSCLQFSTY
jgi:hypothetical protein